MFGRGTPPDDTEVWPVDERALRKLAAAAEHERQQADLLADAVEKVRGKVTRAQDALAAAHDSLGEAQRDAEAAEERAAAAETAYQQAADGQPIAVRAGVADGSGAVN